MGARDRLLPTRERGRPGRVRSSHIAGALPAATRSCTTLSAAAALLAIPLAAQPSDTDWPTITGGNDARRYAALDQIDASNFARLEPAWRWRLPDNDLMANDPRFEDPSMKQRTHVTTPIKIGERLYVVTGYGIAAAVDPAAGTTVWQHDPQSYGHGRPTNHGFTHKGPRRASTARTPGRTKPGASPAARTSGA